MYGLVNQAIEDMVKAVHGAETWRRIKDRAGVDIEVFVSMEGYPDSVTYALVGAAAEILNEPADRLLEAFGEHWTLYTAQRGYGEMFQMGGSTLREFLLNLHTLHAKLALSFPHLRPPSFWCTDVGETSLHLHYQSTREGLAPMVIGLVRGLGRMFGQGVVITLLSPRGAGVDHDVFLVTFAGAASA